MKQVLRWAEPLHFRLHRLDRHGSGLEQGHVRVVQGGEVKAIFNNKMLFGNLLRKEIKFSFSSSCVRTCFQFSHAVHLAHTLCAVVKTRLIVF